jgi:hypothetical protein
MRYTYANILTLVSAAVFIGAAFFVALTRTM